VADGARLILCTAKPKIFAERVVEHFGFASLLSAVYGPELDGRFDDKGDLIEHLLATAHIPTVKLERMTFAFAALDAAGLTRDDSISCVGLRMASALQY
jgi:phosphoglycolate phosphatase-like HAD superfamily hydrolase